MAPVEGRGGQAVPEVGGRMVAVRPSRGATIAYSSISLRVKRHFERHAVSSKL